MINHNKVFVGIDVSKRKLDVAYSDHPKVKTFDYTKTGLKQFLLSLKDFANVFVCLEATGGLERTLLALLHEHDFAVAVVNPRQIRDFARASNQLAKTDQIDARIIAQFAEKMQPRTTAPLTKSQQKLRDLTARRSQIGKMLIQEKNRLGSTVDKDVRKSIKQAIKLYEKQLATIEIKQQQVIAADEEASERVRIIASVPGLGTVSAALLVSELPELGCLRREKIARLTGVAPTNRDSGTLRGKRTTGGGRVEIRNGLFMPIIVAKKYNPTIKAFYERLLANGKPKMVALIACMRKLLTILNTMIKNGETWKQPTQTT